MSLNLCQKHVDIRGLTRLTRLASRTADINDSDFDFCDSAEGVVGIFAGIANQQANPYFNVAAIAKGVTSQQWLEGYFQ
jgi:hypothetical protein